MQHHPETLLSLSPELLSTISHHLKPRHLYRLMQTSKHIHSIVDNEEYWSRAAVHAVFRHIPAMEINDWIEGSRTYPKLTGLYDLVNLDLGYYETMNQIIGRARHMMDSSVPYSEPLLSWKNLSGAPLVTLVRSGEAIIRHEQSNYSDIHQAYLEEAKTMKDVVRREVLCDVSRASSMEKKLLKFQRRIDDNSSHSVQTKRYFMSEFSKLCYDIGSHEMRYTDLFSIGHTCNNFVE
jgi:F-box domain